MKRKIALLALVLFVCSFIFLIAGDNSVHAAKIIIMSGTVKGIYPVFGNKGSMTIASHERIYRIYTGVKTDFHPPRWPVPGEWVKIRYIIDSEGYYRAYDIYIR